MRLKKDKLVPVVVLAGLTLWLLLSGLKDRALDTFRYSVVAGGFDGPTSISYLRLNKTIGFPLKGYISGGEPDRTIFGSSMGLYKPEPVPYQVDARWFSYQTEQFYRIKLEIPEEKQQAIRDFYRQYPERNHTHSLQLGISGKGEQDLVKGSGILTFMSRQAGEELIRTTRELRSDILDRMTDEQRAEAEAFSYEWEERMKAPLSRFPARWGM